MNHLKKFESENKSFIEWLKNPKKPSTPKNSIYIFSSTIVCEEIFSEQGMDYKKIFNYCKKQHGLDMFKIIENSIGSDIEKMMDDDDYLDNQFDEYLKLNGGWGDFLNEYLTEYDSPSYKDYMSVISTFESISKKEDILKFNQKYEEAWFRVFSVEILDKFDVEEYLNKKEISEDKIYIKFTTSREIENEEEMEWVQDYIYYLVSEIEFNIPNRREEKFGLPFDIVVKLTSNYEYLSKYDFTNKLVYTSKI